MSKTTEQISQDCGLYAKELEYLQKINKPTWFGSVEPYPRMLEEITRALYRRIEKLEFEKDEAYDRGKWDGANDALDAGPRKGA